MRSNQPPAVHNKEALHRIHRIQGQLAVLERQIEADEACEHLVIQTRAIEKAAASLIVHIFEDHLECQTRHLLEQDAEKALQEIKRLCKLVCR